LKEIGKILLYLFATVLLGALLAPLFFWGAHVLASRVQNNRLHELLTETDLQRFFDCGVLVAAFALLWPLVRVLRVRNVREDLGLARDGKPWRRFFSGFAISSLSMIVLGACLVATGIYYLKSDFPWSRLAWLPLSAIVVAVLEEFLFRGAIQGVVRRSISDIAAFVFVAALFAAIHFIRPPENAVASNEVTWWSGFALVPHVFWQFQQPKLLLGGFTTIFLVGMILGFARMKTHSLWMPIGLHAGWILGKMSFTKITKRTAEAWPWFGTDILVGLGPVIVLLVTFGILWLWLRNVDAH